MMLSKIHVMIAGLLLFSACNSDDVGAQQPTDPGDSLFQFEQYGTPFSQVPNTEDIIMYEVNLRAFSGTGDIQGVIDNLDHIDSLGVNVIWLMPIHPIGEVNSVNSPYAVKDHKAIGAEYGNLENLRNLTDKAHTRGIAVIMDWVANHTAWDNRWINNRSWYTQDANGEIVHPPGTNWLDVADLNFNNEAMREAMLDAMLYWVYEANVDGFRCDYADGVPYDFWSMAWEALDTIPERDFVLFAEGTRSNHFDAGFDLNFGWESYSAIKDVFNGQVPARIFQADQSEYQNLQSGKHWIRFTTNHDESAWDATPMQLFNGAEGSLAASVVAIYTGGVPLIYGSQEVGVRGNIPFFSNTSIDWDGNADMLEAYQHMLAYYASSAVAKKGENTVFPDSDIISFVKTWEGEELYIIVNPRNREVNYVLPDALRSTSFTNQLTDVNITLDDEWDLSPYEYQILRKME